MVLRILSIIALVLLTIWLVLFNKKNAGSWDACKGWFVQEMKSAFSKEWLKNWKRTAFFILLLVVAISALTGFIPFMIFGVPLGGFALMLHVVLAPIFAILAALFLLSRAETHTFDKNSAAYLKSIFNKKAINEKQADAFWARFFFWIFIIFAVIVASMVFSMYPIFGTIGQEALLNIHRGGSVVLFIAVILFTLRLVRLSAGSKRD